MHIDNFTLTSIHRMARNTETVLSDRHFQILYYVYKYFNHHNVGPVFYKLKKELATSKEEIDTLFPHGLTSVYTWLNIPIHSVAAGCKPIADLHIKNKQRVYFDNNATTPIHPQVADVLTKYAHNKLGYGNPSSNTDMGKQSYQILEKAREKIANAVNASAEMVLFTSGGSESNNTFLKGVAFKNLAHKGRIVISAIEHSSVRNTALFLKELGFELTILNASPEGIIDPSDLAATLDDPAQQAAIAVSIMQVNNEVGTIQDIQSFAEICADRQIPFHSDCVQGLGKIEINMQMPGLSAISIAAHKINGPKGIGALIINPGLEIEPLIHGGGQEGGFRSGTESFGMAAAFAKAVEIAIKSQRKSNQHYSELTSYFLEKLNSIDPTAMLIGDAEQRVRMNLSIGFTGVDSRSLLLSLNMAGVYCSTGSACSSGTIKDSPVLTAMKVDTKKYAVIRFSFGYQNTISEIDYLMEYLPQILSQCRKL